MERSAEAAIQGPQRVDPETASVPHLKGQSRSEARSEVPPFVISTGEIRLEIAANPSVCERMVKVPYKEWAHSKRRSRSRARPKKSPYGNIACMSGVIC